MIYQFFKKSDGIGDIFTFFGQSSIRMYIGDFARNTFFIFRKVIFIAFIFYIKRKPKQMFWNEDSRRQ